MTVLNIMLKRGFKLPGPNEGIVSLVLLPNRSAVLTTTSNIYHIREVNDERGFEVREIHYLPSS